VRAMCQSFSTTIGHILNVSKNNGFFYYLYILLSGWLLAALEKQAETKQAGKLQVLWPMLFGFSCNLGHASLVGLFTAYYLTGPFCFFKR
jgi:hypothetical protein